MSESETAADGQVGDAEAKSPPRVRRDVLAAVFLAAFGWPAIGLLKGPGPTYEEGIVVYGADLVSRGRVPIRDFFTIYGPMATWVPGQLMRIVGHNLVAVRLVGAVLQAALLVGLYLLARAARPLDRVTPLVVVCSGSAVLIALQAVGPAAWWWGLVLTVWAAVLSGEYAVSPIGSRRRQRLAMAAGACVTLTAGFRPDLVPLALVVVTIGLWHHRTSAKRPLAVGAALGALPMVVFAALVGPGRLFDALFTTPVVDLRPFREMPIPPSFGHFDSAAMKLMGNGSTGPFGIAVHGQVAWWFWVCVATPVIGIVVITKQRRRIAGVGSESHAAAQNDVLGANRSNAKTVAPGNPALWQWLALSIGVLPQLIQRPDFAHLVLVGALLVPALAVFVSYLVRMRNPGFASGAVVLMVVFVVCPGLIGQRFIQGETHTPASNAFAVRSGDREFFVASKAQQEAFESVIDSLSAADPGSTVIIAPAQLGRSVLNDMALYYLLPKLEPGSYFVEINPGISNAPDSGFRDDLRRTDWLVLTHFADAFDEPNRSREVLDPELDRIVATEFCPVTDGAEGDVGAVPSDSLVEVLRRC